YVHQYIQETIRRVSLKQDIKVSSYTFLPWKRALLEAQSEPNVLLFSLSRTAKRENKYQWLGEVSVYQQSFHRLKSNPIKATSLAQVKEFGYLLSLQKGSAVTDYLKNLGFKYTANFYYYFNYQQGIKQLFNKRVDLIALSDVTARHAACMEGFDGNQLVPQIPITALAKPLWAVFSKGTSSKLVELFRETMAEIKNEGLYDYYYNENMQHWNSLPCEGNSG
ncbi:MAG: polar amino acid transport system substrate-binding protein, partial [Oceanospirillaceae bacterium]